MAKLALPSSPGNNLPVERRKQWPQTQLVLIYLGAYRGVLLSEQLKPCWPDWKNRLGTNQAIFIVIKSRRRLLP
jgi:hypothetical protein